MAAKRSRTFENLEPQILENLKPLDEPPIITRRRQADIGRRRRGQIFQEKQWIIENLKDLQESKLKLQAQVAEKDTRIQQFEDQLKVVM